MIKNLETAKTSGLFRFNTLIFIRLSRNCLYYYLKSKGIKFVSVLQLGQNHLLEDKQFSRFHSFQDTLNPMRHGRRMLHTLSPPISLTSLQKVLPHEKSEQKRSLSI